MKTIGLANGEINASEIALGCMRLDGLSEKDAAILIRTAMEEGINYFDHADIYGHGKCEEIFSKAIGMNPSVRETVFLQSKCGIRDGYYDFSKEHILSAVDGILKRLGTDYLDVLLLHRPDTLMEPAEVAEAFRILHSSGKVRFFGVSNQNPMQIELLNRYLGQKLVINQLQLSVTNSGFLDSGICVNMANSVFPADGSILEYCRLNNITIQAWSPFQYGFFEGPFIGSERYPELNQMLDAIAEENGVTPEAVAIAWILRHPAKIQPIVGTTNPTRLKAICKASQVELSRKEWYAIYQAAGHQIP
jgi:predicted oxidoreductase